VASLVAEAADVLVTEDAYGFSLADPAGMAGPGRFIRALAAGYDARLHGEVKLHFNSFGGIAATAEWVSGFRTADPLG
jgi:methylenetetrahydrofolate reductase (NADPH)